MNKTYIEVEKIPRKKDKRLEEKIERLYKLAERIGVVIGEGDKERKVKKC